MQELTYKDGLLYTKLTLKHLGKTMEIDNIIVDTGSAHTLIDISFLYKHGLPFEATDTTQESYGITGDVFTSIVKNISEIHFGKYKFNNFKVDFGELDMEINGLLGLDLLVNLGVSINFQTLELIK